MALVMTGAHRGSGPGPGPDVYAHAAAVPDAFARTQPLRRPQPGAAPEAAAALPGKGIYREEAMRSRARAREAGRMPLVISSPSFLLLWIAILVVLAIGIALTAVALEAAR
ncbi:hypothetical protein [Nonomuraea sp. NPDC049695]|uniref:hypothetical protein n=1 Tax=Nonomuraea sp. NPDC049695 TaxID=3154734 RepID=UPI003431ED12